MKKIEDTVPFYQFAGFQIWGLRHLISTRLGGVSKAPYHSLNLGLHTGDNPEAVLKNREAVCNQLGGYTLASLVTMEQCHSTNVAVIRSGDSLNEIKNTDGLVTDLKNTILCALSADCPLCLFYDPVKKVLAVAHSGWKGTLSNIVSRILAAMEPFGCKREHILAGIGPCICRNCYEISLELWNIFAEQFGRTDSRQILVKTQEGRLTLDLAKAIELQLLKENISPSQIKIAQLCTSCRAEEFYSYRRENKITGRFGLFAVLE